MLVSPDKAGAKPKRQVLVEKENLLYSGGQQPGKTDVLRPSPSCRSGDKGFTGPVTEEAAGRLTSLGTILDWLASR